MLVSDLQGQRIYRELPEEKRERKDGTERGPRRYGKVHNPVFVPDGTRIVGFMVSLPDVAGVIKQEDSFVALDAFDVVDDKLVVPNAAEYFDKAAAKRLGIDLDTCIIWTGMDVVTRSGESMGYCSDATFNFKSGMVKSFTITEGAASSALVGTRQMPAEELLGYREGTMVVRDEAAKLEFSGGAAAKAAEASVKVSTTVKKGAQVLDDKGSKAVDKGSRALGKQLGRTKGMFGSFVSEYKKAAGTADKKKAK